MTTLAISTCQKCGYVTETRSSNIEAMIEKRVLKQALSWGDDALYCGPFIIGFVDIDVYFNQFSGGLLCDIYEGGCSRQFETEEKAREAVTAAALKMIDDGLTWICLPS